MALKDIPARTEALAEAWPPAEAPTSSALPESLLCGLRYVKALLSLTKPGIVFSSVFSAAAALFVARLEGQMQQTATWVLLVGMTAAVAGACALNMLLERDSDKEMARTSKRVLPAGLVQPRTALWFGLALGAAGIGLLSVASNLLATGLTVLAFVSYVWIYTPLKRKTPFAFVVGLFPGALPVLVGWVAAVGSISTIGWLLFGVMLLWQLAHALALTIYLRHDYAAAGVHSFCGAYGVPATRLLVQGGVVALVVATFLLFPLVPRGWWLAPALAPLGGWFLTLCFRAQAQQEPEKWARKVFGASLLFLTSLLLALTLLTVW